MKVTSNGINIKIEQDEIDTLWNVIMFALDYDSKENVMMQSEKNLANELVKTLESIK